MARITKPRQLIAAAERQGFTAERKTKGVMLKAPDGRGQVMLHLTNSDHRSLKNAIALLKRIGFDPTK